MKTIKCPVKTIVVQTALAALFLGSGCVPRPAFAVEAGDADVMFNSFNKAFLVDSSFYKQSVDDQKPINTWQSSLNIMAAEDAYERTGSVAHKELVNELCASWIRRTPPPWDWDGWNDDIGWFSTALVRGYQMTGNPDFLAKARYGFDMAWKRGWDTKYNGGGIWEQQPEKTPAGEKISKEALSNDTLGVAACLLYQSTHEKAYLDHATQIYAWVRQNLYDEQSGQLYTGIERDGKIDKGAAAYNQGLFIDYANTLYGITGDSNYFDDAKRSIDYAKNNMTRGGIFSDTPTYRDTWADTMARGVGHFVRDNRQWAAYYPWMVQNADAILKSRRTDLGITYNGWDQPTPRDNSLKSTQFVSAVAWLQFTPATKPTALGGVHTVVSKSGVAIDTNGLYGNTQGVVVAPLNEGQEQKWNFTQNEDESWNIVNMATGMALDCPGGAKTNGLQMIQWQTTRNDNQRWWVDAQADGSFKIWNQASGLALHSGSAANGYKASQEPWTGQNEQRWNLQ